MQKLTFHPMNKKGYGLFLLLSIIVCLIVGCASNMVHPISSSQKVKTAHASYNDVWENLLYVLNVYEFPIILIEKDSGIIGTDWVGISPYDDIGKSALHYSASDIVRNGKFKLSILVTRKGARKTDVRINANIQRYVKPFLMDSYYWSEQNTNGIIEKLVFDGLSQRMGRELGSDEY